MSEWWLFRNTRIENINEQYEIARKHLPDTTHWLGSEHNYFYIKCCDVARSVYSDGDILTNRSTCESHHLNMTTKMIPTTMSYYPEHLAKSITTVSRSLSSSFLVTEKLLEDRNVVYL